MIRCGLAKSENNMWGNFLLFPDLKNIIAMFLDNFDGVDPDNTPDLNISAVKPGETVYFF